MYCGIDLHARRLAVGLVPHAGDIGGPRTMPAAPAPFLQAGAPYRDGLVGAVAGIFPWYGLAALGTQEGLPCGLGPALARQALHGGKAQHAKIASPKIAALLRGGRLPQAAVSPAARRAPRALRQRRRPRRRQRAALLAPLHPTTRPYHLPEMGTQMASQAHRAGGAERLPAPAGPTRLAGALALIDSDAPLLPDGALSRGRLAPPPAPATVSRLPSVPGRGTLLRRVRLADLPDRRRGPRGPAVRSDCRRVQGAQASAGQRDGPAGAQIGNAERPGAVAEATGRLLREPPAGPKSLTNRAPPPGPGPAAGARRVLPVHPAPGGRSAPVAPGGGRGAGEPHTALDGPGGSLESGRGTRRLSASVHAQAPRGPAPGARCGCLDPRCGSGGCGARRVRWTWAAPPPRLALPGERAPRSLRLA